MLSILRVQAIPTAFLLLAGVGLLAGCGGHRSAVSSGSSAATDTIVFDNKKVATVTDDAKAADEAKLNGQFGASWGRDNSALAHQLVAAMQTMAEFREGGIGSDGTAWGRYADGTYVGFLTNDPDGPGATPAARAKPLAPANPGRSAAKPKELPGAAVAYVYEAMEPERSQATATIVHELTTAGYRVVTGTGSLADWASVSGAGLLINHSHGAITDGNYYLTTSDTPTVLENGLLFDELQRGDLMRVYVEVFDSPTTYHDEARYALNINHLQAQAGFTTMFAKNSLFLNMTCSGTETGSAFFSYIMQVKAGLDVYAGWNHEVETDDQNEMALFFLDRTLGLDKAAPVDPSLPPPANWRSVKATMSATLHQDGRSGSIDESYVSNGHGGTVVSVLKFIDSTDGKLTTLIPSATSASLTADGTNIDLKGDFGADQGTVTVAGESLAIVSWRASEIVAAKPDATGPAIVTSPTGLIGNPVPITGSLLTITPSKPSVAYGSTTTFTVATELGTFPASAVFTWKVQGTGTVGGSGTTTTSAPHVDYLAPGTATTDTLTVSVKDADGKPLGSGGTRVTVDGSYNILPSPLPIGIPLYGGNLYVQNTAGLPAGVRYVWTAGMGNLLINPASPPTKTLTTTQPYVGYQAADPFPGTGAVVNDHVSLSILDASGKQIGSGNAVVALGGASYMDITYPFSAAKPVYRYTGATRSPTGPSIAYPYGAYQLEIPDGNGGDFVDIELVTPVGSLPSGTYTWKQYYPGAIAVGDLYFNGQPAAGITSGTLTINSAIPAPDGGTFIGYSFHFATTSAPVFGNGVQNVHL